MQGPRQVPPGRRSFRRPPSGVQPSRPSAPPVGRKEAARLAWRKDRLGSRTPRDVTPPTHWVYLHGFASSPQSQKAQFFRQRLEEAGLPVLVPDLNVPSFEELTITAMLETFDALVAALPQDATIGIIGSSLGGLVALFAAGRHASVRRLLLLAPPLGLFRTTLLGLGQAGLRRWEQAGYQEFHHHGTGEARRVSARFIHDARKYDESQLKLAIPITIVHGTRDEFVDPHVSVLYAHHRRNVTLHLVDDDHSLLASCTQIWEWLWKDIRPRQET